jgi:3-dehydrotetronate 4-kinase
MPSLGCIADDFTGATDLATNLVLRGLRTVVALGVPGPEQEAVLEDADAVVVALKSRTAPVERAVADSRAALAALRALGCRRFYVKYCSTFDSTPRGNIGPVIDAVATDLGADVTVVVPAFPAAGRTVYQGHLFVGDRLLSDSSMRHHPLTPMLDSDVVRLLEPQTRNRVALVPHAVVRAGAGAVRAQLDGLAGGEGVTLAVVDALDDDDLRTVAAGSAHLPLVTGGSGLALGMEAPAGGPPADARVIEVAAGRRAVLSGSASAATRAQVAHAKAHLPWRKLDLEALRADLPGEIARTAAWAGDRWAEEPGRPVLVFAVESLDDLEPEPPAGAAQASEVVERALGECARAFSAGGARQLLVAGGETSGTVVGALGVRTLTVGPQIAPGFAWAAGADGAGVVHDLALKSGNFGAVDAFTGAWKVLA